MLNEAAFASFEGVGTVESIDFYDWRGGTRAGRADLGASGVPDFSAH